MSRCEVCGSINCYFKRVISSIPTETLTKESMQIQTLEQIVSGKVTYKPTYSEEVLLLIEKLKQDPTSLDNERVLLSRLPDGHSTEDMNHFSFPKEIIKVIYAGKRTLVHLKEDTALVRIVYEVYLWQLKFSDATLVTILPEVYAQKIRDKFLSDIQSRFKAKKIGTAMQARDYALSAREYERQAKTYRETENKLRKLVEEMEKTPLTEQSLLTELEELKKHAKVADAYMSVGGGIVITTKELFACDPVKGKEDTAKALGVYVIKYRWDRGYNINAGVQIWNQTFCKGKREQGNVEYYHPHIRNEGNSFVKVCWGSNEEEVKSMYESIQLYMLTDFIILFLSTFPHTDGSPYTDYWEWYEQKEVDDRGKRGLEKPL